MKASENERHTLPVAEEKVTIHKHKRVTETLQARTVTREHEQPIEAELSVEALDVERVPFDRFVDHPIPDRQEGDTTIISVIEEVAILEVRLKLVEEVRITRRTGTRKINDAVKLRRQEVTVERRHSDPRHHHISMERMMSTIVVGLYKEPRAAKKALQALVAAGCQEKDIETFDGTGNADKAARELLGHGFEKDVAQRYGTAIKQGHTLVAADIADQDADAAEAILDENGAIDLPEAATQQAKATRGAVVEEDTVPVVEETVEIGKRRVSKGGVRVTTEVTETPVRETVRLRKEEVDVEHHKVDRPLSQREADAAFEEKTLEMTATSETPKVTKEARVVEEVVLSKRAAEHAKTVEATARRTDVKVESTADRPGTKR